MESTYGDRLHENRRERRRRLQALLLRTRQPGQCIDSAFSIGRTQELFYELEDIIHRNRQKQAAPQVIWDDLDILIDSPLAADFTQVTYGSGDHWDREAKRRLSAGRHPLAFDQRLTTIDSHATHLQNRRLSGENRPPGHSDRRQRHVQRRPDRQLPKPCSETRATTCCSSDIRRRARRGGSFRNTAPRRLRGTRRKTIRHPRRRTPSAGYSAHADQKDLINFIDRMRRKPQHVRLCIR